MIEHNLRLVVYIAKKFDNTGVGVEDLISIGTIGLIKSINTFKPDKNIKLATYASRCIENEILMYLRKTKRKRTEVSFEDSLSFDSDGNELHLEDASLVKQIADKLQHKHQDCVIFVMSVTEGKVMFVAKSNKDYVGKMIMCGNLVKQAAILCGGNGGGRPDFAQAGGKDVTKVSEAIETIKERIKAAL